MRQRFINNFSTTVAATFGTIDTQLTLTSVAGLPALSDGEYFHLTVYRQTGIEEREHEVIKVTAINGNILTVVRAVEGAAASQFIAGDRVQARVTAASLQAKADQVDMDSAKADIQTNASAIATKASQADLNTLTTSVNQKAAQADLLILQDTVNTKAATTYVDAKVAALVDSSPATLDTLKELATALGNDANFAASTSTALGNRLRVDVNTQGLTVGQKANAVTNLGLAAVATTGAKADVGLANVDNTSDVSKPVSTAQQTALDGKENSVAAGTTAQFYRGDKTWQDFATDVRSAVLTGLSTAVSTAAAATDSVLVAIGKLQAQIALQLSKAGGTMEGDINMNNHLIHQTLMKDIGLVALDKGNSGTLTQTFDYSASSEQKVTATGDHAFAFSNWPPAGNTGYMRVDFNNYGAFTITPPIVVWTNPDGTETTSLPDHFTALAAAGGRSGFTAAGLTKAIFWSKDAGANVYGKFI